MQESAIHFSPGSELLSLMDQQPVESAPAQRSAEPFAGAFRLFLASTAVLFIRPGDLFPSLAGVPIYEILIILTALTALPLITRQLRWRTLRARPVSLFVLCMLPAIVLSHLSRGDIYEARIFGFSFLKVLVYYFLLVGLVNTPRRLKLFLTAVTAFIFLIAVLSLLNWHSVINLDSLTPVSQVEGVDDYDQQNILFRLQGPGIFNDPNDFSIILVTGMLVSLRFVFERGSLRRRIGCAIAIAVFAYALNLTQSRGGLLSCLCGVGTFFLCRFGFKKRLLIPIAGVVALLIVYGGRQANFDLDNPDDTFQGRLELWRDSMVLFHQSPIFGIGSGNLDDEEGLVAHNSYVHSYAELGFFGGTAFVGVIACLLAGLWRVRARRDWLETPDLIQWWPSIAAIAVGFFAGISSLSRVYTVTTYFIFAVICTYLILAAAEAPGVIVPVNEKLLRRTVLVSLCMIVALEVIVRVIPAK